MNIVNIVLFVFALFHGVSVVVGIPAGSKPAPVNQPVNHAQRLADSSHQHLARAKENYKYVAGMHQEAVQVTQTAAGRLDTAKHDIDVEKSNKPKYFVKNFLGNKQTKLKKSAHRTAEYSFAFAQENEKLWRDSVDYHRGVLDKAQKDHDNIAHAANAAAGGSSQNNDAIGG